MTSQPSPSLPLLLTGPALFARSLRLRNLAGGDAAYVIEDPNDLTKAALLGALTLTTYNGGTQQETASGIGELELGLLGASDKKVVSFTTTLDFDEIRIDVGAVGTAGQHGLRLLRAIDGQHAPPSNWRISQPRARATRWSCAGRLLPR